MGNGFPASKVEVGRIVFRSWEHEWQTGDRETFSLASAKRLLPSEITRAIYEVLERWERDLLRSSLPYAPYGLRIRRANSEWLDLLRSAYKCELLFWGVENATKYGLEERTIGELCPNWDAALPEPRSKQGRFGTTLHAPSAGSKVTWAYGLEWRAAVFPEQKVNIDDLLRQFSPRYREPTIFG
jgi:hypothetical protein